LCVEYLKNIGLNFEKDLGKNILSTGYIQKNRKRKMKRNLTHTKEK